MHTNNDLCDFSQQGSIFVASYKNRSTNTRRPMDAAVPPLGRRHRRRRVSLIHKHTHTLSLNTPSGLLK